MSNSRRSFVTTLMILASLMLLGGSLVTKQHAMVQNSPGQSLTDDDCEKLRKRLTEAEKAVKDALDYENYTAAQYTKALDAYDQIKKSVSKGLDFAAAIATADTQIESSNHAIASDKEQLVNAKESGDSVLISVYEQDISDNEKSIKLLEEHKLDLQKQLKKQNEPLEVAFKQMMAAKMDLWDAHRKRFFQESLFEALKAALKKCPPKTEEGKGTDVDHPCKPPPECAKGDSICQDLQKESCKCLKDKGTSPLPALCEPPPSIPANGVPGEGEDCAEFRKNYNDEKEAISKLSSPEDRRVFEIMLEGSRHGYCKCLVDKHISPLPEACKDVATTTPPGPPPPTRTPTPTPSPTPTPNPAENKKVGLLPGYHVDSNSTNGLYVTTFSTPQGKIKVNLTDDLAAGDTISGTVETEPAGKNDAERAQNQAELNGYVVELEGQKTKVGDKKITCKIPTVLIPEAKTIVLQHNGQTVATTEIPISATAPPPPTQFTLPTGGQQGKPLQLKGPCDGVFSPQDHVKVGPTILPPVAESPRSLVVQNTSDVVGPTNIECNENGATMQCPFRNIGIKLSAPKLNLQRGETTTLHVQVLGLAGMTQDVLYDLIVTTPNVIKMSGGNVQGGVIQAPQVQPDGTSTIERILTGVQAGGFGITGTIRWSDVCKQNGAVARP